MKEETREITETAEKFAKIFGEQPENEQPFLQAVATAYMDGLAHREILDKQAAAQAAG